MSVFSEVTRMVFQANPDRDLVNAKRRAIKLVEELGEVAEAWLNITSTNNGKSKTWDDVREEIADCLIVAIDIAVTVLPEEFQPQVWNFDRKLHSYENFEQVIFAIIFDLALFDLMVHSGSYSRARIHINRVVLLAAELNMTPMPDQPEITIEEIERQLLIETERKVAKWLRKRKRASKQLVTESLRKSS